jgi:hypothetical protein
LEEFLAGTDPTIPASVLRVQIQAQVFVSKNVTLNWPAVLGKKYQIQFKDNLTDPVWSETAGATVVGTQGSFTVPASPATRFFRAVCVP